MTIDNSKTNTVRTFLTTELLMEDDGFSDDQELLVSGLLDSINVMRLVGFLETEFSTTIPPEDVVVENFSSVSQIMGYLQTKTAA